MRQRSTVAVATAVMGLALLQVHAAPGDREVTVDKLPANMEEFVALRDKLAVTPDGGAAIYVLAAILYTQNQELGLQAITVATDLKWLEKDTTGKGYKGYIPWKAEQQRLRERFLSGKEYVPRCYVQGTSAENGYALPAGGWKIKVKEQAGAAAADGTFKLFVYCTGADSPRPMTLRRNDKGLWKVNDAGSLQVACRAPVAKVSDDL